MDKNEEAYRRLKAAIAASFPAGRFVGIHEGEVVADADSLPSLIALLKSKGKNPAEVLAVQAGVDYPQSAIIF